MPKSLKSSATSWQTELIVLTRFLLLLLVTLNTCCGQDDLSWVREPTGQQRKNTPGLIHETVDSKLMKTRVGYCVVLPPGYETNKQRYPVVYWLHGGGGNECSSLFTANTWQTLYRDKAIDEVILVYPNGRRSGYMDHHHGKIMIESLIMTELIPQVDAKYRTIASREGRAVHGFSMGSSGALKFVIKYPEMFCSAVAYGGGAIDLEKSKMPFITNIMKRNFDGDPKLIRRNNTYRMLESNHKRVREIGIPFLLISGEKDSWTDSAKTFQKELRRHKLECNLRVVPGVAHNIRGLFKVEGAAAARFQDKVFRKLRDKNKSRSAVRSGDSPAGGRPE